MYKISDHETKALDPAFGALVACVTAALRKCRERLAAKPNVQTWKVSVGNGEFGGIISLGRQFDCSDEPARHVGVSWLECGICMVYDVYCEVWQLAQTGC